MSLDDKSPPMYEEDLEMGPVPATAPLLGEREGEKTNSRDADEESECSFSDEEAYRKERRHRRRERHGHHHHHGHGHRHGKYRRYGFDPHAFAFQHHHHGFSRFGGPVHPFAPGSFPAPPGPPPPPPPQHPQYFPHEFFVSPDPYYQPFAPRRRRSLKRLLFLILLAVVGFSFFVLGRLYEQNSFSLSGIGRCFPSHRSHHGPPHHRPHHVPIHGPDDEPRHHWRRPHRPGKPEDPDAPEKDERKGESKHHKGAASDKSRSHESRGKDIPQIEATKRD